MTLRFRPGSFAVFLLLAALLIALAWALRPTSAPYLELLHQGDAHAAALERTAAVAAYREAARLRPDEAEPYLRLARIYLDWGQVEKALDVISEAERRSGAEADRLERLWIAVYAARTDWPAVVEHAGRLLARVPADRDVRHALAWAHLQLRQWDAARAEYEALLQTDPADSLAHERLGVLSLGDDPAAIQHLYTARSDLAGRLLAVLSEPGVTDDLAYANARIGRVLFEAQEWALAARQFERALALSPDYADAHAYLGYVLDQLGQPADALSHLQRAVALTPNSVVAHLFMGLHYDRQGDWAAARAEYEAAYDLDPQNPAICIEIGGTWAAEDNYVAAEIWLGEAVRLQPDDPALWEVLARFYLDCGITGEGQSIEAADRLLALSPDSALAYDLRGWAALQSGDYRVAEEHLTKAIARDPMLAEAHYHLGLLWQMLGKSRQAREAFTRAVDLDTTGELGPLVERALGESGFAGYDPP